MATIVEPAWPVMLLCTVPAPVSAAPPLMRTPPPAMAPVTFSVPWLTVVPPVYVLFPHQGQLSATRFSVRPFRAFASVMSRR